MRVSTDTVYVSTSPEARLSSGGLEVGLSQDASPKRGASV